MFAIALFVFGLGVGVLSGLLGIGGGIVLVPGLVLLFGLSQQEAQGTSLAALIPPIGLFAALVYYQHGYVRLPVVGVIAVGFMIGAYGGAQLVAHLPPEALRGAFGVLLLFLGFTFLLAPQATRPAAALPAGIATLASTLVVRVWKAKARMPEKEKPRPRPPGDGIEYHI
jgi:uncharacterized membrane protein YfcA